MLITYLKDNFTLNSEGINKVITYYLKLSNDLYFYSKDKKCIELLDIILKLCEVDSDFEFADIRKNDILFQKGLSLHRLKKYDKAFKIYSSFHDNSKLSSPIAAIDLNIYMGHIFRIQKDKTKALEAYNYALKNIEVFIINDIISEQEGLIQKIRIFIHLDSLFEEFGLMEEKNANMTLLNITLGKAFKFAPPNIKDIKKKDYNKYPLPIAMLLMEPRCNTPVHLKLNIRCVTPIDSKTN